MQRLSVALVLTALALPIHPRKFFPALRLK